MTPAQQKAARLLEDRGEIYAGDGVSLNTARALARQGHPIVIEEYRVTDFTYRPGVGNIPRYSRSWFARKPKEGEQPGIIEGREQTYQRY